MNTRRGTNHGARCCAMAIGLALLAGCSSSFGGGADPSQPNTVVVPPGTQDGSARPCN